MHINGDILNDEYKSEIPFGQSGEKSNEIQSTKVAVGIVTSSGCRPKADLLQCDITTSMACRMLLFPT